MLIDTSGCDFLDLGSGFGGCIDFARKKLGGGKYMGFESHDGRANDLRKKRYNVYTKDITKIEFPKNSVRFVTISHVLEHLNSLEEVEKVVFSSVKAAKDFVFIEGPSFDFDEYLEKYGMKFFWRDGHGHYCKVKIGDLLKVAKMCGIKDYSILVERPFISDSSSKDIHPISSPKSVANYNKNVHPKKKFVKFDREIFRSFIMFLWINPSIYKAKVLNSRAKFVEIKDYSFCML